MSRTMIPINHDWKYSPEFKEAFILNTFDDNHFEAIMLPHMNQEIPYNYFDEKMYQFISCYRKHFNLDSTHKGKRIFVDFEGVMTYAKVYLNGHYLGEHKGGYTPFSFELTEQIIYDGDNTLTVMVDSTERDDIPPFGHVIDYLTYGGIYREVNLRVVDDIFIENVFAKPKDILQLEKQLQAEVFISNLSEKEQIYTVQLEIANGDEILGTIEKDITLKNKKETFILSIKNLKDIKLWDINEPNLYQVSVHLILNGQKTDTYSFKTGFRMAEFTPNGFLLNGRKLKLRGLNRHQSFPYVGYAMPKRAQVKDADILKDELHLNMVRTSHYPQSKHFLNRCDEIGLLVFEELPGWQHIGDKSWQQIACQNVIEMIQRDFNHPSIVLWGVRINESEDNHDFYTDTNRIAHEMDETRQTGGVRFINDSELLEDVYTVNDFAYGEKGETRVLRPQQEVTGLKQNVPYLNTEYNGHMYPTKRFDQEERLNEHALRHSNVLSHSALDPHKCGAIGWCAFDYNTHYQFGSGDRICYHGVMDMFRIPKFAAYAYSSQVAPEVDLILEPVTIYSRGERAIAGIAPLTIFTNCDSIQLYDDQKLLGEYYPSYENYAGLEYPPIIIEKLVGTWGMDWNDLKIVGLIKGQEVITKNYIKNPIFTQLSVEVDDFELNAGEMDVTRIVIKAVDQIGHMIPFIDEIVTVDIEGPAKLIGSSTFPLIGGCRGVWIKTTGEQGMIKLVIRSSRVDSVVVEVVVK